MSTIIRNREPSFFHVDSLDSGKDLSIYLAVGRMTIDHDHDIATHVLFCQLDPVPIEEMIDKRDIRNASPIADRRTTAGHCSAESETGADGLIVAPSFAFLLFGRQFVLV